MFAVKSVLISRRVLIVVILVVLFARRINAQNVNDLRRSFGHKTLTPLPSLKSWTARRLMVGQKAAGLFEDKEITKTFEEENIG